MTVITDQRGKPVSATMAWVVAVVTVGYMLPWAIAATRGKSNHWGVFWVTLLTGWTIVGWVIGLWMSLTNHHVLGIGSGANQTVTQNVIVNLPPGYAPQEATSTPMPTIPVAPHPEDDRA